MKVASVYGEPQSPQLSRRTNGLCNWESKEGSHRGGEFKNNAEGRLVYTRQEADS